MPLLLIFKASGGASGGARVSSGVVLSVVVNRAVSGLRLSVATSRPRVTAPLYLGVRTHDPLSVLPPPVPGQTGGGKGEAYIVTHSGLPELTTDYTITGGIDGGATLRLPKLSATIRGKVSLTGQLAIGVRVGPYAQAYGPFAAVGHTYELTPTGWVTRINSIDPSEADATPDSPLMPVFEEEYLTWERERDLTPRQQARRERDAELTRRRLARLFRERERALEERLLGGGLTPEQEAAARKDLKAYQKAQQPPPDRRRTPVQEVIQHALSALPFPFKLAEGLPYAADFFWASENTGRSFNGGKLKGVSFQVKGKTPVQVLEELLNPIGWQVVIRFGVVYIGPPEELEEPGLTPGLLELPSELLTGLSIEQINPDLGGAGGNAQLPRKVTITGATAIKQLEPLDPEPDEAERFSSLRDATLTEKGTDYSLHPLTRKERVDGYWTLTKEKRDDLLRAETYHREGVVPNPDGERVITITTEYDYGGEDTDAAAGNDGSGDESEERKVVSTYTLLAEKWSVTEDRQTRYFYEDVNYPQAETRQTSTKKEWRGGIPVIIKVVPPVIPNDEVLGEGDDGGTEGDTQSVSDWVTDWEAPKASALVLTEEATVTTEWAPQGWLKRRTVETTTYGDHKWPWGLDAPLGRPETQAETEEWQPINADLWQLTRRRRWQGWEAQTDEEGAQTDPLPVLKSSVESILTDQGPPRAPDDSGRRNPDEDEEPMRFPYEEPLVVTVFPGGRAEPQERAAPWATQIDPKWTDWVAAGIRRARPAQRTRYSMKAPPRLELGTRIREFSISGKAGSVDANVTVEEELDVQT